MDSNFVIKKIVLELDLTFKYYLYCSNQLTGSFPHAALFISQESKA